MNDILQRICAVKRQEIAQAKAQISLAQIKKQAQNLPQNEFDFVAAIQNKIAQNQAAVIAEIKKASPSKGLIREDFNPAQIAQSYTLGAGGINAACLSVLTDQQFFKGHPNFIKEARRASNLPILCKDFMLDEYQIFAAKIWGANCILLIAACLDDAELLAFEQIAQSLGLAVLVEVHNLDELKRALKLQTPLIGVNNRNLRTFEVDLQTSLQLKTHIPNNKIIISESGIHTKKDVQTLRHNGINAFLVGESLMRQTIPGLALAELFAF